MFDKLFQYVTCDSLYIHPTQQMRFLEEFFQEGHFYKSDKHILYQIIQLMVT
jgi:hypothetical protein